MLFAYELVIFHDEKECVYIPFIDVLSIKLQRVPRLMLWDSGSKDRKTITKTTKIQTNNRENHTEKFNVVHY